MQLCVLTSAFPAVQLGTYHLGGLASLDWLINLRDNFASSVPPSSRSDVFAFITLAENRAASTSQVLLSKLFPVTPRVASGLCRLVLKADTSGASQVAWNFSW